MTKSRCTFHNWGGPIECNILKPPRRIVQSFTFVEVQAARIERARPWLDAIQNLMEPLDWYRPQDYEAVEILEHLSRCLSYWLSFYNGKLREETARVLDRLVTLTPRKRGNAIVAIEHRYRLGVSP